MKDQNDGILDTFLDRVFTKSNKDPKPVRWEPGFRQAVHAMVQLGDDKDDETRLLNEVSLLQVQLTGLAEVLTIEKGRALRRTVDKGKPTQRVEPIEHFGYFDGISQPLFTAEDLTAYYDEDKKGTRGGNNWDPSASLNLVLADDPFTDEEDAYGSFLVYRKLHQHVGNWEQRVGDCAATIGQSPELTGALAVGRFKDGTPVVVSEVPTGRYKNDFEFKLSDPDGFMCPAHAHIRKVNPRGTTPKPELKKERNRRIARRGIPYGRPMPNLCDDIDTDGDSGADRGLLFLCFQANIEKQFEFIQETWVDNPNFPDNVLNLPFKDGTGDDPLIGQDLNEKQRWPKQWGDPGAGRKKFILESAVTLKGGEYFFAPSLPFLKGL